MDYEDYLEKWEELSPIQVSMVASGKKYMSLKQVVPALIISATASRVSPR